MRHGADWYKREPLAYLGGVQGMKAVHHAVYGVVIELCYVHGGAVNNDPKWIAGWIGDMGSSAVRKAIAELIEMGKLFVDEDRNLSQKRAKSQAKTKENLRENAAKSGKKGGINSAKSRANQSKINEISEATASSENQADKIREEKKKEDTPPTPLGDQDEPKSFDEFWQVYPHRGGTKKGRAPAEKAYRRALARGTPEQEIIDGARASHRHPDVVRGFARDPASWLNQQGWQDEIAPNGTSPGSPGGGYWTSMGFIREGAL